jgi:acetyl esterase
MPLDPDAARILAALNQPGRTPYEAMTPAEARAAYAAGRIATIPEPRSVAEVRDIQAELPHGRIALRLYRPESGIAAALPGLVYLHGGGWVLGSIESHDGLCRHLAAESGCAVISVEYRLAPEHPFPAALDDALGAFAWVRDHAPELGLDADAIGIGGDSAGGALALAVSLTRRDAGQTLPRCQLLIYPVADLSMSSASHRDFAEGYLLTQRALVWFRDHYAPAPADVGDWRISPLRASSFENLPPSLVLTAEFDPLRDEGEALALKLANAGLRVTTWRIPGQIHGFLPMGKVMTCAQPILDILARHLALDLGR